MKYKVISIIAIIIIVSLSCVKENEEIKINCSNLISIIISFDSDNVELEINKLTIDLKPKITVNDNLGQKENIDLLINRLNNQCTNLKADLFCYACVKTLPPQSEIFIEVDSLGKICKRIIDILTPDDNNLTYSGIHGQLLPENKSTQ